MQTVNGFRGSAEYTQSGFKNIVHTGPLMATRGQAIQWALDYYPDADEHSHYADSFIDLGSD